MSVKNRFLPAETQPCFLHLKTIGGANVTKFWKIHQPIGLPIGFVSRFTQKVTNKKFSQNAGQNRKTYIGRLWDKKQPTRFRFDLNLDP